MSEINLLPWRQALHARTQRKQWFYRAIFMLAWLGFLWILHLGLVMKNQRLDAEILLLKKQHAIHAGFAMSQPDELINVIQTKQNIFWRWFYLLGCLSQHHLQLVKMDYKAPQIFLMGHVASMMDLSSALMACHFPKDPKISISPLQQSDFLQFSIHIF